MWFQISDEALLDYLANGPVTRALADDEATQPAGGLWSHMQDMAARHLIVIENDTARLK